MVATEESGLGTLLPERVTLIHPRASQHPCYALES